MSDFKKVELAFDIVEGADVMHVFDDVVWVSVDRESWEEFTGVKLESEEEEE